MKIFDFKMYGITYLPLVVAFLVVPCMLYLPKELAYENGLLENIQMLVLFFCFYMSVVSKNYKKLFTFVALFIVILMLREVNCGRTLFFPIPGEVNMFYSWKDIPYGWLAHPLYGLYIAFVVLYFLKNKLFLDIWNIIKKSKIPVWNVLLLILGLVLSLIAEKFTHNFPFEEISELLMYTSIVSLIWLYTKNDNCIEENTEK